MTSTECAAQGFAHGMGQSGFSLPAKGASWPLRVQLFQGGHHCSDLSTPHLLLPRCECERREACELSRHNTKLAKDANQR